MLLIIIIISIIIFIIIAHVIINQNEHFDFAGTYPYYRDPYSIYLWYDIKQRLDRTDPGYSRAYLQMRNFIYEPIN